LSFKPNLIKIQNLYVQKKRNKINAAVSVKELEPWREIQSRLSHAVECVSLTWWIWPQSAGQMKNKPPQVCRRLSVVETSMSPAKIIEMPRTNANSDIPPRLGSQAW
jgi:hypothetical protein